MITKYIHQHGEQALISAIKSRVQSYLGVLPSSGFLAGQAIASAVYEICETGLQGTYNDSDVFVVKHSPPNTYTGKISCMMDYTGIHLTNIRNEHRMDAGHADGHPYLALKDTRYSIHSVGDWIENINVNVIFINTSLNRKDVTPLECLQTIVDGFDINAVEIGLCLATDTLYFTTSFEHFLTQRQLKINESMTPVHSVIRLGKKMMQIKGLDNGHITCELERMREVLAFCKTLGWMKPYAADMVLFGFRYQTQTHEDFAKVVNAFPEFGRVFRSVKLPKIEKFKAFSDLYTLHARDDRVESLEILIKLHILAPIQHESEIPIRRFYRFYALMRGHSKLSLHKRDTLLRLLGSLSKTPATDNDIKLCMFDMLLIAIEG